MNEQVENRENTIKLSNANIIAEESLVDNPTEHPAHKIYRRELFLASHALAEAVKNVPVMYIGIPKDQAQAINEQYDQLHSDYLRKVQEARERRIKTLSHIA